MKVFISWSGEASRSIAAKIYDWLPMVLQSVQPYMSSESIDKGTRWSSSVSNELEGSSVGIVILTPDNLKAPWIYFESGALAKVVGDSRLAPLLCGLKPSDIGTPLSQFQVTVFNKDDILKLLKSINLCAGEDALPESRLEKMHNALWEDISKDIDPIIASEAKNQVSKVVKTEDDTSRILEELLVLTRQQSQLIQNPEKHISKDLIRAVVDVVNDGISIPQDQERIRYIVRTLYMRWAEFRSDLLAGAVESEERKAQLFEFSGRVDIVLRELIDVVERSPRSRRRWQEAEVVRPGNAFAPGIAKVVDEQK